MPPIKLKLNLAAVAAASPSTPTPASRPQSKRKERKERDASEDYGGRPSTSRQSSGYSSALGLRMSSVDRGEAEDEDEEDEEPSTPAPEIKPTIRLNLSALSLQSEPQSTMSSTVSTPMSVTPVSTPGTSDPPKRKRGRPPKKRPTAIPPHLVTPRTTPRSLATGLSTPMSEMEVQADEDDMDPLARSLSPAASAMIPVEYGADSPTYREGSYDTPRQTRWKRVKRPFNELANKVLHEMRRKDSYGFFLEPVSIEEYPDYWERIGGEDKAMDLGTMQNKLDEGLYSNMDELEADFRKVIDAAKTFNAPGTMPVREAGKVFAHGMKHIDRARPLVLTPSPSPSPNQGSIALPESERSTPHPGATGASTPAVAGTTAAPKPPPLEKDVPPKKRIPSQMLEFPPNSLQAKAVGWNQTGGRRVRPKRFVRGRERFIGKWRDWCPDGSRDIAEMDDPATMLETLKLRKGEEWSRVIDWRRMREEEEDWWEWDGLGGPTGQPPLPGAERLKPKPMQYRYLEHTDLGAYPQIQHELKRMINKGADKPPVAGEPPLAEEEIWANQLRPDEPQKPIPAGLPAQTFQNIYERTGPPAKDFLYNVCLGGLPGEAYTRSVQRFIDGALDGAAKRAKERGEEESEEGPAILQEYVAKRWHDGVVQGDLGRMANDTVVAIAKAIRPDPKAPHAAAVEADTSAVDASAGGVRIPATPQEALAAVDRAYGAIALSQLTAVTNPLDLAPLLRDPSEFMYAGIGAKSGVLPALEWISNEIQRLGAAQDIERRREQEEKEKRMAIVEAAAKARAEAKARAAEEAARAKAEAEKAAAAQAEAEAAAKVEAAETMDVDGEAKVDPVKTEDGMDLDEKAANGAASPQLAGTKRSSAELSSEEPEAKRSRVSSPVANGATEPVVSATVTATPEPMQTAATPSATPTDAAMPVPMPAAPTTDPTSVSPATPAPAPTPALQPAASAAVAPATTATPNASVAPPAVAPTTAAPPVVAQPPSTTSPTTPAAATPVQPTSPAAGTPAPAPVKPAPATQTPPAPPAAAKAAPAPEPMDPKPYSEEALRQLRLELVAVSKFYPLASLKKMTKDQAKQLLPANVRGLMTRGDDKDKEKDK